jgi:hypothetical protein
MNTGMKVLNLCDGRRNPIASRGSLRLRGSYQFGCSSAVDQELSKFCGSSRWFEDFGCKCFTNNNRIAFQIKTENCGKGNGYLSMVLKLSVEFEGRPDFNFVLKIPMPGAMTKMIGGEKKEEEEKDNQVTHKQKKLRDYFPGTRRKR